VALRVKETDEDGVFEVSGRGELHLTILLEEHAPRGLRAGREQAARGVQGHRRRSASRSSW
jgi:predicted membrane GTPase involved in stress response